VVTGISSEARQRYHNMINELNEETFLMFAIKHYDNPGCTGISDLQEDLKRFVYLRRLLTRYENTNVLNERLIVNHLLVLYNVFNQAATDMIVYKLSDLMPLIKPFLVFLNRMKDTELPDVFMDRTIVNKLRGI
jgi:hypothetical protein